MSRSSDIARLEQVLVYLDDIRAIVKRHKTVALTLSDKEGQYAVLLCLSQIGELLGKVESPELRGALPIKMAIGLRNIIVHNYEGVDMNIVANTIEESLPGLKSTVAGILQEEEK